MATVDSTTNFKLVKQGAEAKLYMGSFLGRPTIVKERFSKTYRHPDLDDRLTKERMRAELRGLLRAKSAGINAPTVYFVHSPTNKIYMEFLSDALTVNEFITSVIRKYESEDEIRRVLSQVAAEAGRSVGLLHKSGTIHGDLTTSNILLTKDESKLDDDFLSNHDSYRIYLIDFGLSHVDTSAEDKGVDLYVLERALTSTHSKLTWFFDLFLQAYLAEYRDGGKEVMSKLEEIRLRGRKRTMIG